MQLDIIIFAVITVLLILRLKSVLGVKDDDSNSEPHIIIKSSLDDGLGKILDLNTKTMLFESNENVKLDLDETLLRGDIEQIKEGLEEISEVDKGFNLSEFIEGAKYAFEIIVTAYSSGDRAELKPLLSPKLFEGFDKAISRREEQNRVEETNIKNIEVFVSDAHLKGTMAYVTIDYDVEKTTIVKEDGEVITGDEDSISTSQDIWTFTRDTRSEDPNWILIETKAS